MPQAPVTSIAAALQAAATRKAQSAPEPKAKPRPELVWETLDISSFPESTQVHFREMWKHQEAAEREVIELLDLPEHLTLRFSYKFKGKVGTALAPRGSGSKTVSLAELAARLDNA